MTPTITIPRATLDKVRAALDFYADERNQEMQLDDYGLAFSYFDMDGGVRAQEALSLLTAEQPTEDEVEHYENCECCQNFHRMEEAHDKIKEAAQSMAKALKNCSDTWKELGGEAHLWVANADKALTAWVEAGGEV